MVSIEEISCIKSMQKRRENFERRIFHIKGKRNKNFALLTIDKFGYKMSMEGGAYDVAY